MVRTRLLMVGVLLGSVWLGLSGLSLGQEDKKGAKKEDGKSAALKVIVPHDDAKVTVNRRPTKKRGTERLYAMELLTDEGTEFNVPATWDPNNYTTIARTKKISVKPGENVTIDFRKPT